MIIHIHGQFYIGGSENSIARDFTVKSTCDFLKSSWSDVSSPKSFIICEKFNIWKHQIFQSENKEAETTKCLNGNRISQKKPDWFLLWLLIIFGDRENTNILGAFLDERTLILIDSLKNQQSYDENLLHMSCLHTFVGTCQELNESLVQDAVVLEELGRKAFPD
ncbi:hypothetical protein BpHYR1_029874 [Brachionus plicatilis]|uniref:Uncharacterized protein n=1 Tax=Brachionus plicatilis TaxID=10195 RepID=A0A3M7SJE5_BRAPC|nr:hypothetical protein BpHYR1_029874 [Brachionus plicatilis]